jgi:hypothetical protein
MRTVYEAVSEADIMQGRFALEVTEELLDGRSRVAEDAAVLLRLVRVTV